MLHLAHPELLRGLYALPLLLLLLLWYRRWRLRSLQRLGDPAAMQRTIPGFSGARFWLKNLLLLTAMGLLTVAMSNPQRGAKKQTVQQQSSDVFIALDISQSMLAKDLPPRRLDLAKAFVLKLVKALEGERIGLIFFAGNAFLQMPLSTDYGFIAQSVQSASPDLISNQGTAIPAAIDLALKSYDDQPTGRGLVIVSDGENHDEDAVNSAAAAYDDGVVVYTIGVGTPEGGPIPLSDADNHFKQDEEGKEVRTQLNESLLRKVAQAGGGAYYPVRQSDNAVDGLRRSVENLEKRALEVRSYSEFESKYRWFLLPALLLLLLETALHIKPRLSKP